MDSRRNSGGKIFGPLKKYLDHMPKETQDILTKMLLKITDKLKLSLPDEPTLEDALKFYGTVHIKNILLNEVVARITYFEGNMLSIWPNELYDLREVLKEETKTSEDLIRLLLSRELYIQGGFYGRSKSCTKTY
jgi:hypothetical protein